MPYGIVLFFNNIYGGVFKKDLALFLTAIVVTGSAAIILLDAFFIHIDAQNGFIFLFLPAYQIVGAIIGGLIGLGLHQRYLNAQQAAGESTGKR